ncbi:hypothetical protein IW261DRAFT_1429412 [Armillaria novae-zelandiae]|uniref:Mid2 domain-containing protein n=1 Tax=Armillaria novae-zelandiae TaxID=153914 RepID=A0AA39N6P4_9AGAR|nr:hypothetical protein IW261DRAFT_1429412 [Armillaria novae-zelandiae]
MVSYSNSSYDDRLAVFKKAGSWKFADYNISNVNQIGMLSWTVNLTANVTFTFPSKANAFYYYGLCHCCGALYAICVDCDPQNPNFDIIDAVNSSDDGKNPPVILYSKTFDQLGIHKIILKNQPDPRGNSQLMLDRFELQVEDDSVTSATESLTLMSGTSSSPSISVTQSTTAVVSQSVGTSSSAHYTSIGAIVGGVVGAIMVISLCLIIWFLKQRQNRTQPGHTDMNTNSYTSCHQHSPFMISHSNTPIPTAYTVMEATSHCMPKVVRSASVAAGSTIPNASLGDAHPSSSCMAYGESRPQWENDVGWIDTASGDTNGNNNASLLPRYEYIVSGGHLDGEQLTTGGMPIHRLPTPEVQRHLPWESGLA